MGRSRSKSGARVSQEQTTHQAFTWAARRLRLDVHKRKIRVAYKKAQISDQNFEDVSKNMLGRNFLKNLCKEFSARFSVEAIQSFSFLQIFKVNVSEIFWDINFLNSFLPKQTISKERAWTFDYAIRERFSVLFSSNKQYPYDSRSISTLRPVSTTLKAVCHAYDWVIRTT